MIFNEHNSDDLMDRIKQLTEDGCELLDHRGDMVRISTSKPRTPHQVRATVRTLPPWRQDDLDRDFQQAIIDNAIRLAAIYEEDERSEHIDQAVLNLVSAVRQYHIYRSDASPLDE